jgi:predicted ester cyclase
MNSIPPVLVQYMAGLKTRDVAKIASTVADDASIILIDRTLTKPSFLAFLTALYTAFPDWLYERDEPVLRDDGSIAVKWRQSGTHTAAMAAPGRPVIAATGKSVRIPEQFFVYKVADGKIVEIRPDAIPGGAPWGIFEQIS